jgi:hypothetical protein
MKSVSSEAQEGSLWSVSSTPVPKHAFSASSTQRAVREVIVSKNLLPFLGKFTPKLSVGLNTWNPLT